MAKAIINLQKESGGIVKISPVDGVGVTEVTVPESGSIVSIDGSVTDNAIARYDGTTGKLQNSGVTIDDNGNLLLTSGTGALGYGSGAGGTVIQLTSKSTAVTLNKPSGTIYTHNAALAANSSVLFLVSNNMLNSSDTVSIATRDNAKYEVIASQFSNGNFSVKIKNITAGSLSEQIVLVFTTLKGSSI